MLNCKKNKKTKKIIVDFIVILVAVNVLFQSFGVFAVVFVCDCLLCLLTYRIVTRATGHKKPTSFVHNAQCHNFSTKETLCITFRFPIFPLQICSSSILWGLIRWLGSPRLGKYDSLDVWEMRMLDAILHGMRTHADSNLLNLYCTVARTWTHSLPRGCFNNIIGRASSPPLPLPVFFCVLYDILLEFQYFVFPHLEWMPWCFRFAKQLFCETTGRN